MAENKEENQQPSVDLHQQLSQIRESISDRTGCLTDLEKNKKRWVVTGIVLHSVLSPTLREHVTDSLEQIYQTLKQNNSIDTQTHPNQLKSYLKTFLNYEAINGNKSLGLRQQSRFNYEVKDAVDFSKLFLKTHMAHFSAFDGSCDSSALLEIIIGSFPGSSHICAKQVKDEVRNPWAHCDFTMWDDNKYKTCMKLMKELIESLGIQNQEEIVTILEKWNQNGEIFIDGTSPEFVVLGEIQTQVHTLLSCIERIASDTPDQISKLKEELTSAVSDLMKRVQDLEKVNQDIIASVERLNKRIDENEDSIPKHMKGKYQIHIDDWVKDEEKFIVTRATKHVADLMEEKDVVVVTGSSGSGKSSLIHHVALKLKNQGFTIIPFVSSPDDIIKYRDMTKNQLFIIDDLCGKNYINEIDLQIWKKQMDTIKKLFPTKQSKEQGKLKILVSCRLQIYKDEKFKSLKIFTQEAVDLQSGKYCLLSDEKRKILGNYITNEIPDYKWQKIQEKLEDCHFFPLLCKIAKGKNVKQLTDLFSSPVKCLREDIRDMIRTNPMENCALVLCVLFPDGFDEDFIDPRRRPQEVQQKVIDIIDTYEINLANERKRAQLRDTFKRLDGTYVKKTGTIYTTSHDKLYDIMAVEGFYEVTELYLNYAPSTLIAEQFRFTSVFPKEEDQLLIYLNDNDENLYFKRCFEDLHKKSFKPIFKNQQLKHNKYRNKVMEYIDQNKESCDALFRRLDREGMTEERKRWFNTHTYTTTPLIEATKAEFYQMIEYLIDIKCDLNKQDSYNCSPLWYSWDGGFINIINLLLKHNVEYVDDLVEAFRFGLTDAVKVMIESELVDLNRFSTKYKQTPLNAACSNGSSEIALLLLSYNVNYNIDDLVEACRTGMTDVVRVMIERGLVDLGLCGSETDQTPLNAACEEGHSEIVSLLLSHNVNYNVNDLVEACRHGMTDVVRVMMERGLVDLGLCGSETDQTPLNAACEEGDSEIVSLLLGHNVDYNVDDLVMACRHGMTDVVRVMMERGLVDLGLCGSETDQTPLNAACEEGDSEIVSLLLGHNVDYNVNDLVEACRHGMTDVVRVMIERGLVDLGLCGSETDQTPLNAACEEGDSEIVSLLLSHNVNYNVNDLVEACRHGMTDVVRVMIERGLVDLTQCDSETDQTPLNAACEEGHNEVVSLLLCHNVDYNVDDLVMACRHGNTDAVRVMIERGLVDLGLCGSVTDQTPLNAACEEGHSEIVSLLLNHNVNYNVDDLVMACRYGMTDVVRVMVERRLVDLGLCGSETDQTPLNAACKGGHREIVNLLLNHNLNYNVDDLVEACKFGMTDAVIVMIERKLVDLTQCGMYGYTPLRAACAGGHSEIVNILLSHNVNYNFYDLVEACRWGMTDAVRVMVERGLVDLTQCDKYGYTPLMAACRGGRSKIVRMLLEGGADPTQRDGCGKIALDYTYDETIINLLKLNTKQ